jgi:hypothetical protein
MNKYVSNCTVWIMGVNLFPWNTRMPMIYTTSVMAMTSVLSLGYLDSTILYA